jgi:hypothetical protein
MRDGSHRGHGWRGHRCSTTAAALCLALVACQANAPAVRDARPAPGALARQERTASARPAAAGTAPPAGDAAASATGQPPTTDPPGAELARRFAQTRGAPAPAAIPPARQPGDNNPGNLVRPSSDVAAEVPRFVFSPDGKRLAFVRLERGLGSIWLAAADGSDARQVLDLGSAHLLLPEEGGWVEAEPQAFFDLRFSPDGSQLFFQTDGWGTSFALYGLDLATGKASFVVDTNGYTVIESCAKQPQREGQIVAYRHSYEVLLATAYDAYFLVDPHGRELGIIGPEPGNVERFLTNSCSLAGAAPVPAAPKIRAKLRTLPTCGGPDQVLRYAPIHFLDGTELALFYVVKRARAHAPRLTLDDIVSPPIPSSELADHFAEICATP